MKDRIFIDPSAITSRELSDGEMSALSGGLPIAAIIWVTSCGEGLAIGVAAGIITIVE